MDCLDKVQYSQQIHDIGSVFFIALGCNFIFSLIICLGISCSFSVNEKKKCMGTKYSEMNNYTILDSCTLHLV